MITLKWPPAALAFLFSIGAMQAQVETFFAEDLTTSDVISPPRPKYPNSQAAAAAFVSQVLAANTENFEGFESNGIPCNLTFGTGTNLAILSRSSPEVSHFDHETDPTATTDGAFPISGTNFVVLDRVANATNDTFLEISFSHPQSAFGFYGTDVEVNRLRLTLVYANGSVTNIDPPITANQFSGGAFYLGVIDHVGAFVSVIIRNLGELGDGFAFDDMTIGVPKQHEPEPAVLELLVYPELRITGTVGASYRIEYSPVLPATNWTYLRDVVLETSPSVVTDTMATNAAVRFYRAIGTQ